MTRRRSVSMAVLLIGVVAAPLLLHAASSTVSPGGDLQGAIDSLQAGDTLLIASGTYPGFRLGDLSGSEGAPITIKAEPGATVVIDGAQGLGSSVGVIDAGSPSYVILGDKDGQLVVTYTDPWLDQARALNLDDGGDQSRWQNEFLNDGRVEIRGIHFEGGSRGHHVTIQYVAVQHIPALGIDNCPSQSQYIGNTIADVGYPRSGYGFYCSGDAQVYTDNVIHDATFGFHLYSETGTITNAVVSRNRVCEIARKPWWHMSSGQVKHGGAGIHILPGEGSTVEGNTLVHNATALSIFDNSATVRGNMLAQNDRDYDEGSAQDSAPGTAADSGTACATTTTQTPTEPTPTTPVVTIPPPRHLRLLKP